MKTTYQNKFVCPAAHDFNPINAELNPTFHLLALLGAHHILHVSRIRVNRNGIQPRGTLGSHDISLEVQAAFSVAATILVGAELGNTSNTLPENPLNPVNKVS